MRPGGGYGATICAHIERGVEITPCPFGPASSMPSSSATRDQLALERAALLARLAVAAARDEGRAHAARRAGAQQLGVRGLRRAHEDEVGGALRQLGDVADRLAARAPRAPSRFSGEDLAARSRSAAGCESATKPNLPGCADTPATSTPRGWKSGAKRARTCARPEARAPSGGAGCRLARARRARRPRPAAVARRSTISGFRSTLATSGRSCAEAAERDQHAGERVAVDRRLAAEGLRRAGGSRAGAPISARASACESGAAAKTTSPSASVRMPPRPSSTQGPNCGSRTRPAISSRLPRTCSATSSATAPSSGRAAASSSRAAARTAAASPSPRRTRSRSVLCAMASPQSFSDDREADLARRPPRPRSV